MSQPNSNPEHYNSIRNYCQDSGLFYNLQNEPDLICFGDHNLYGTSLEPEIIYYYDPLFTFFYFLVLCMIIQNYLFWLNIQAQRHFLMNSSNLKITLCQSSRQRCL